MKRLGLMILAAGMVLGGLAAADRGNSNSLYERLGGMPAIRTVVDKLVGRILADERVNMWFAHTASDPEHAREYKAKLADFICQGTGGPCKYQGADMVAAHKGRGVTEEAFNAVVEDLVATLDELKVPDKEKGQLLGILAPMKAAIVQEKK